MEKSWESMFAVLSEVVANSDEARVEEMFAMAKTYFEQNNLHDLAVEMGNESVYPRSALGLKALFLSL